MQTRSAGGLEYPSPLIKYLHHKQMLVVDVPCAGVFTNLSTVALSNNQLTGPLPDSWGENANLPGLQSLDVSANNLSGPLPSVWGHNNSFTLLTNLNLANNTLSGGLPSDWANSGRFPALQQLEVQYNQLSGVHAGLPVCPAGIRFAWGG